MVPKPDYHQLTPLVLNQAAPTPLMIEVRFDSAPSAVKVHLAFNNTIVALNPDASGKVFTAMLPPAALLTGLSDADVNRAFIGHMMVTLGPDTDQYNLFGDVLTAAVPPVSLQSVAADVQFSDHLVNIQFPGLADTFDKIQTQLQLNAISHKFYAHFDDEYDFLQIVFARDHSENRYHFATRNEVKGIGMPLFNITGQYGSASRLLGLTIFPYPTGFDGGSAAALHELGHQWIDHLAFPPFAQGNPHWPLSDLAEDIMGFSIVVNGQSEGGQFNFDLQPVGGDNFKMVPNDSPKGFSDLSLYLMGMVPANQVSPHFVFNNQAQTIVANGILNGPVTQVTINDVIAHAGARSPDAAHAQKRFRVATILVTRSELASPDTMRLYDFFSSRAAAKTLLPYRDGFLKGSTKPFNLATNGIGRLDPRIKRHILIDASRDGGVWWFPQRGPFVGNAPHQGKKLADHLRSLGHTVKELPPPTTITAPLLADFDIVIRVVGKGPYSAAEIAAYDAWVKDGGGLLLLAEHHPQDTLASHFGLKFQGITRGKQLLSQFAPHPLTAGVAPVVYSVGSGIIGHPPAAAMLGWLSADSYLDLNDNAVQDPGEPSAPAVLGVLPFGQGRIVFCGDANLWEQVPQPLIKNMLSYFAAP